MNLDLKDILLSRYEKSAGEYVVQDFDFRRSKFDLELVPKRLVGPRYVCHGNECYVFRCRRCLHLAGPDQGNTDLSGLCDKCWVEVDSKFRGEKRLWAI